MQSSLQTAGLVIAARLAEDASISVAVLEAGRDNYKDFKICMAVHHRNCVIESDLFQLCRDSIVFS